MVRLALEPGDDQLHGLIDRADGHWRPFWGWLEMMQAIEDAIARPGATVEDRQESDG
jgi:hypothetical protein